LNPASPEDDAPMILRLSHVGLCVADLERSLRFYVEGLGFRERSGLDLEGEPSATLLELPGVALRARWLERDGTRLELLHFPRPGSVGDARPRPMNALGLTHLSFRVADLSAALARLEALGGRALTHTRVENHRLGMRAIFLADPDGTRIELIEGPGDPEALPGARR
jgi:catechol 2,3-dioxygenase-like lactoylglutathione lyase family enzyme